MLAPAEMCGDPGHKRAHVGVGKAAATTDEDEAVNARQQLLDRLGQFVLRFTCS